MLKDLRIPFFTVLFIFIGLFVFPKFFGPIPFSVNSINTNKQNLFTVSGTSEVTAVPDTAMISLGVNKDSSSVQSAKDEVNKIINQVTSDLKSLGVDEKDIKTTNYSVNPNYDYISGTQKTNGYSVNATIEVKIKTVEKANNAIDIATKDGATNVGGVQFVVDDAKQKQLEDQARKEAIGKAKEKAASIANAAGIHLGRIVDVQENGDYPRPVQYSAGMQMDTVAKSAPTQLNPGENKISSTVSLSYETY
ncbi:MAG TPA: SIMPL domain-containing protein [Candidatus Saccharimonadales bacterium]|nr:SIMPL domain-containing protein [Candidatus Saccharimonadales bacterium]